MCGRVSESSNLSLDDFQLLLTKPAVSNWRFTPPATCLGTLMRHGISRG
jgi:hypothetical protein